MTLLARLGSAVALVVGRRQPAQGSRLAGLLLPDLRTAPPPRGTAELLRAYSEMPWLRAVAHKIAVGVGAVPWRVLGVRRGGRFVLERTLQRAGPVARAKLLQRLAQRGELEEVEGHPLVDLLHAPNPFLGGVGLRRLTALHVDLAGEAFWIAERPEGGGPPVGLWPLAPHWVRDVARPGRPVFALQLPGGAWRGGVPMSEIAWIRDPDPADPYGRGSGTARALTDELETDEFAAKYTRAFFHNQARPDLVITVEGAREPDVRAAEQRWLADHQGFWRAFKPMFSSRRVTVDEIGSTFRDQQFVQLRQHQRDTILQCFGVSPELLGVLENANRATAETAEYLFTKWVLVPRLELLREVLQERLAPLYDERLVIDYESPVAEDRALQLEAAKAAPWSLTANEWRSLAGHAPLADDAGRVHGIPPGFEFREHLLEPLADNLFLPDPEEDP